MSCNMAVPFNSMYPQMRGALALYKFSDNLTFFRQKIPLNDVK